MYTESLLEGSTTLYQYRPYDDPKVVLIRLNETKRNPTQEAATLEFIILKASNGKSGHARFRVCELKEPNEL